ncbi:uncharacterized protein PGTG_06005 [Puccinia graminis f. sp. tritici CRL 75-36-700-3]|uniref:PXA domain-containing protein n=1 Tax=Puccinia graminis f. sp. tritici (strain CRL 75-36-700-3 / race SCCL) TaxID=418459 RepID=E3K588_PUCGT|nr:uncharacterized protein PGTG_06005 [Puccinia graminis f. sp. tritici CRL 75-36-700-3]EFP79684.1 hypothetical protein PGTG_06005 [Puccinia graminis f. sp. tritici CRL 75-36-700-3]
MKELLEQLSQLTIKLFILTWYSPLSNSPTPKLHQPFIRHINTIITTSKLSCQTDTIISLLLLQLPLTLNRHLEYIQTIQALTTTEQHDFNTLFIQLHPHPALIKTTTTIAVSPSYLRLLIEAILKILLPKNDYDSEPERLIIRETILNQLLLPLFTILSQPSQIHRLLLTNLLSSSPRTQPAAPPPPPPQHSHGFLTPIILLLNSLGSLLLHLSTLLGSFILLLSSPPPIPLNHQLLNNNLLFLPLLDLSFSLLGKPGHLAQLFWLLKIFARLFHRLLLKIAVRVLYDHLLSPSATTKHLQAVLALLHSLDQSPAAPSSSSSEAGRTESWTDDESQAKLEELLASYLSSPLFFYLIHPHPPILSNNIDPQEQEELIKRRFVRQTLLRTLNSPVANQALLLELLDLFSVSLFPQIIEPTPPSPPPPSSSSPASPASSSPPPIIH